MGETRATCHGYSFTSVSTPPTILLDLLGIPHWQEEEVVVVGAEVVVVVVPEGAAVVPEEVVVVVSGELVVVVSVYPGSAAN